MQCLTEVCVCVRVSETGCRPHTHRLSRQALRWRASRVPTIRVGTVGLMDTLLQLFTLTAIKFNVLLSSSLEGHQRLRFAQTAPRESSRETISLSSWTVCRAALASGSGDSRGSSLLRHLVLRTKSYLFQLMTLATRVFHS